MRPFKIKIILLSVIFIVLSSALIVHGGGGAGHIKKDAVTLPSIITTATPMRMNFTVGIQWFGRVKSRSELPVYAMSAGRIILQKVTDGSSVRRGDALFIIGGSRALGKLKALKQKTHFMKKRIMLAEKDVRIKKEAVKRKMIRGDELRIEKDYLMKLKSELAGLQQTMTSFREGLTARAPVDGVFTNRVVTKGQYVEKGARLADIISPRRLRVTATLFAPHGAELKDLKAVINLPGGRIVFGEVKKVMPRLTAEGARVLWIESKDIDTFLRPGESLSGLVKLSAHRGALSIPESAVVSDDKERDFVFLKKNGKYIKTPIKRGLISGKIVEVASGIKAGDEVVVTGAYELFYRDFSRHFKVAD